METLQWIYRLHDNVTGPAGRIERSLKGILGAVERFPSVTAVAKQGLEMLIGGARQLGNVVIDGGKFALGALAFKESTLASFELMLGTKKEAKEFFDLAKGFGKLTPFETEDVVASFQQLLQAGFSKTEVPIVFQALGDVAAGKGFDKQVIDRLTLAFGQIRSKGKLMGDDLRQVVEAGVGRGAIFEHIAQQLGVDPKSIDDVMSKGRISADVALTAMLDTIRDKFSGGKELGQGMLQQATTIRGLMSTLASAPMDMFLDIDLDSSKGFKGIKTFMSGLVDALNPDSLNGGRLKNVITDVVDDVGGLLGSITVEDLTAGFKTLVDLVKVGVSGVVAFKDGMMEMLGPTFELMQTMEGGQDTAEGFRIVMAGLGVVLGAIINTIILAAMGIGKLFNALKRLSDFISSQKFFGDQFGFKAMIEQLDPMLSFVESFGADIVKGLANGILSMMNVPVDAILNVGRNVIDGFKSLMDINSPSGVFEDFGQFTAEGFARGVDGGRGMVDSSVTRMVTVPAPMATRGGGGRAPINVTLNFTINGAADDGDTIARKIADLLPSQLTSLLEQISIEDGEA